MKTPYCLVIWVFLIGFMSNSSYAQSITTHDIILLVDTSNFDRHNPAASCEFSTGEGTVVLVGSPAEEFTIEAEVGDLIRWSGRSSTEPEVTVEIKKIKYEKGVNLFPEMEMDGINVVEGTITKGREGDDYKYIISFKIGGTGANYNLDPKIQIK